MTPLERAARALYKSRNEHIEIIGAPFGLKGYVPPFEELHPYSQRQYLDEARAVLQAIREPSEAMVSSAHHGIEFSDGLSESEYKDAPIACWQAMVDAALSEER